MRNEWVGNEDFSFTDEKQGEHTRHHQALFCPAYVCYIHMGVAAASAAIYCVEKRGVPNTHETLASQWRPLLDGQNDSL